MKLIHLLNSLSAVEKTRFRKYLQSPFFNTDNKLLILLDLIVEHLPAFVSREQLHQRIFPKKAYNYHRISNLLSYLTRFLKDFLAYEHMTADSFEFRHHLLMSARKRGLDQIFQQESRKFEQQRAGFQLEEDFYQQFVVEEERNVFFLTREERTFDQSLSRKIESLDLFYVTAMLKNVCQQVNRQNILQGNLLEGPASEFIVYIRAHIQRYASYPNIQIYYHILLTLLEPDEAGHFQQLKGLLESYGPEIPAPALHPMYQYVQNYCIKQSNRGREEYLGELLAVYQTLIDRNLLKFGKWISPWDVKNIVALGIRLSEFAWTEAFLQQFQYQIAPEYRDNSLTYNYAHVHYAKKEYRKAMRLLTQVEFEDVFYLLGAKTLLLKIYYELKEEEGLDALLHAFATALRRNRLISDYQREVHLNLIRFVKKLAQLRSQSIILPHEEIHKELSLLEGDIQSTQAVSQKNWLLTKVSVLGDSFP
ncbi:MAG: hypothetical protein AAF587_05400 [Bacteroidota bacterium]